MIRLGEVQLSRGMGVLVATACAGSLGLAGLAGLRLFALTSLNKDIDAYRQLSTSTAAATPSPAGRPLLKGAARELSPSLSEVLNRDWERLGLKIYSVETVARRSFGRGLQSWSVTVRARGPVASGAKVLAWAKANEGAVMLDSVSALPDAGEAGDWTFVMFVLVAPTEGVA